MPDSFQHWWKWRRNQFPFSLPAGETRPPLVRAGESDEGGVDGAGQAHVDAPHPRLEGEPLCGVGPAHDPAQEAGRSSTLNSFPEITP